MAPKLEVDLAVGVVGGRFVVGSKGAFGGGTWTVEAAITFSAISASMS